jgi:hypothetical protein
MRGEEYRLRDDFLERNPYWKWRIDNYASINVRDGVLEMCMGPTEAVTELTVDLNSCKYLV